VSLVVRIDHGAAQPVYEQIRMQVHALIEAGALQPGDRLPPVRQLAADLATAAATVARAYQELERDGVLGGQGRRGSMIIERRAVLSREERSRRLEEAARAFVASARALGVSAEEASRALATVWQQRSLLE
jgi:DNA-binding transcriptional regulator YhcF (GntR family)